MSARAPRPVAALALSIALLLLASTVALLVTPAAAAAGPALGVADLAAKAGRSGRGEAELRQQLPALEQFVATQRGLAFVRPVAVELLPDRAFLAALGSPADGEQRDGSGATFVALGVADHTGQRGEETDAALAAGVTGFYDPSDKRLVVRAGALTPLAKVTLVHELTHALQDQVFGLNRKDVLADSDRALAWRALVEGDATRVERAYRASLPADERRTADEEERRTGGSGHGAGGSANTGTGSPVVDLLGFPYAVGPDFVGAVLRRGGQPALDALFRDPPTSTRQVLDPVALAARRQPVDPPRPALSGKVVDEDVLGVVGLVTILTSGPGGVDPDQALPAVRGWAGDRYATTVDGTRLCTRDDIVVTAAPQLPPLAAVLRRWARAQPAAMVSETSGTAVSVTSCRNG